VGRASFRILSAHWPRSAPTRCRREEAGIVERRFYEQHPPRAEFLLTKKGEELRPVLRALYDSGQRHTRYRGSVK
jgi:DNA-binding HxlR family transcriptional regulator